MAEKQHIQRYKYLICTVESHFDLRFFNYVQLDSEIVFLLQKLQSELDTLRSSLGDVSRRCVSFFEEKPTSSSVPVLRSELNQAVEKTDKLHNLSSVYLEKLVESFCRLLFEYE